MAVDQDGMFTGGEVGDRAVVAIVAYGGGSDEAVLLSDVAGLCGG